ncbi:MAG: hypothetical protein A2Y62_07235 [Candidatus Fischerbacteria bacterium RBG_13_37_8]|uniref:Glycosyltransferase 2-like domain-containing protein n=1 Tax=Candidatus Fischerbacteria bacterium RBG_13_37_8 TaxID=1817863 RepID=A0A1F5VIY4_9BACT|nr:MAG: hypothetical protein A2Y62_07235 [Candidatus Fischerbacteria bacterium RBG_13_37_8]
MNSEKLIDVSFIIISYRDREYLEKAIRSIYTHVKDISHEVLVIDNANDKEIQALIEREYSVVRYYAIPENKGYGYAVNEGAAKAASNCFCIMNSDIEFISDGIKKVIGRLRDEQQTGIAGPRLVFPDMSFQRSWGLKPTVFNEAITQIINFLHRRKLFLSGTIERSQKEFYAEWLTGACFFVKKEVWEELEGFDTHFFLYLEDADLCLRALQHGYKILYCPELEVIHYLGKSKEHNITQATLEAKRSQLYFYKKHNSRHEQSILKYYLLGKFYFKLILAKLVKGENSQNQKLLHNIINMLKSR